jgi:N-acetylglutamate synthase-like GNAT family acetyltransferase
MISEKYITKFEKEILLQQKIEQLETELKEFSVLQKKAYSPRLQKSIAGLENRILRAKKLLYNN